MASNNYENVEYLASEGIAWITVNRPEKLNALDTATVREIVAAARNAMKDDGVRVLVVTGAGEKAFVAGADIGEMSAMAPAEAQRHSRFLQHSLDVLERSRKPVLAAVNGFALGGGCELAMACHVRIAADNARFGQPEVNLGLIPGAGGTQRLQRLVGRGRALDLIMSGNMIDAVEAHRIGLVNMVVPASDLQEETAAYATNLMKKSPMALSRCIEAIVSGGEVAQPEGQRSEAALFGLCFATEDMKEGTAAFLEKRKPSFQGK
jgi:enoyl-CoA hydratase